MREVYVYYRVLPGQEHTAAKLVQAIQLELAAHDRGLRARLLQRADDTSGTAHKSQAPLQAPLQAVAQTWMEIYTHPNGISAEMLESIEAKVQQAGLIPYLDGTRHIEIFMPCA